MSKLAEAAYLRRNTRLIRHAAIRRILAGRYHTNGISTYEQLGAELEARAGFVISRELLSKDLRELGAVKVKDEARPNITWWVIPAYNPNVENLRDEMDPELIESEVAHKLAAHVMDIAPVNNLIYVTTEPRAGALVGYWLSWLAWPGIIMVQESLDACVVHCISDYAAVEIAIRLIGDQRLKEEGEDDE